MGLCRNHMRLLGIWPGDKKSNRLLRSVWPIFISAMVIVHMVTQQLLNMVDYWGNINRVATCIAPVVMAAMGATKVLVTWYYEEDVRTIIVGIYEDWKNCSTEKEHRTMLDMAKKIRVLITWYTIISTIAVSFYAIFHCTMFFRSMKEHRGQKGPRYITYGHHYFYDTRKSPSYEVTFFSQTACGVIACFMYTGVATFIATSLLHICAQFVNLRDLLSRVVPENVKDVKDARETTKMFKLALTTVLKRHQHLIELTDTIVNMYTSVLLPQMMGVIFHLCFVVFRLYTVLVEEKQFLSPQSVFLVVYVPLVVTQLFVYCYTGEKLLTESTNFSNGAYECAWYNLNGKEARVLALIIQRSRMPLCLTAGKFSVYSMQLFCWALKASMGYVSVLLTIKEKISQ